MAFTRKGIFFYRISDSREHHGTRCSFCSLSVMSEESLSCLLLTAQLHCTSFIKLFLLCIPTVRERQKEASIAIHRILLFVALHVFGCTVSPLSCFVKQYRHARAFAVLTNEKDTKPSFRTNSFSGTNPKSCFVPRMNQHPCNQE